MVDRLDARLSRLLESPNAEVSFAGDAAMEERPTFLGAMRDFLTENRVGVALKRVFFAGMAALSLSSAIGSTIDFSSVTPDMPHTAFVRVDGAPPTIDTDNLFKDRDRFDGMFKALASDFDLELVSGDVQDADSMRRFGDALGQRGISGANELAHSMVASANDLTPVGMQFFSGVDATGASHHVAAITYDSSHNDILKSVFSGMESVFGDRANEAVEVATWTHETMHAMIKGAEQDGLRAWQQALKGDFSAFEQWSQSVGAQLAHPDVASLLSMEVDNLRDVYQAASEGKAVSYDASSVVANVRTVQGTAHYTNYHENMADGLMSMKMLQDGYDITGLVGTNRAALADHDPVHDSSVGQAAIGQSVTTTDLQGMNGTELASMTAKLVRGAMQMPTDFEVVNDGLDNGVARFMPAPGRDGQGSDRGAPAREVGRSDPAMIVRPPVGEPALSGGGRGVGVAHGVLTVDERAAVDSHEFVVEGNHRMPVNHVLDAFSRVDVADPAKGRYVGKVSGAGETLWVQDVGRGQAILHENRHFEQTPKPGCVAEISYRDGRVTAHFKEPIRAQVQGKADDGGRGRGGR